MLLGRECQRIAFSAILRRKCPELTTRLIDILECNHVQVSFLEHSKDIWCRDYMPAMIDSKTGIQFHFDPLYYKSKKYSSLRTNPATVTGARIETVIHAGIVLDGGNLVCSNTAAIVSDRIFEDNPQTSEEELIKKLKELLKLKHVVVIPQLPGDSTGHADGMVRWIDNESVLLSDFSKILKPYQYRYLRICLLNAGLSLVELPNQLHLNRDYDDATGDHINFLEVSNTIIIPQYGLPSDKTAFKIFQQDFPARKIVPVRINELTVLGGGLNCISWHF